jgi:hypothetical protein
VGQGEAVVGEDVHVVGAEQAAKLIIVALESIL